MYKEDREEEGQKISIITVRKRRGKGNTRQDEKLGTDCTHCANTKYKSFD